MTIKLLVSETKSGSSPLQCRLQWEGALKGASSLPSEDGKGVDGLVGVILRVWRRSISRLEGALLVWCVEPVPASLYCLFREKNRAVASSAVGSRGLYPSWCLFEALRLLMWLCCDTALPVSVVRCSVVTDWLAGIAGAYGAGLWLTMLPDAGSRGRFGPDMSVGAVSAGPEAEEAGRASAGSTSTC
eukprot:scaffold31794_cov107-Isochrysis_galbana.AAC.14